MSVYDLATDVGLAQGSDEYEAFVACVQNILEHGTGYSPAAMQDIVEKCNTSELDVAQRVVRECRREKTSAFRKTRLQWWETYVTRRERISRDIYVDRTPSRPNRTARAPKRQQKRSMTPMYERKRQQKRPMSPVYERKRQQKRPMSPMFERKRQQKRSMTPMYERKRQQKRPMSPVYERKRQQKRPMSPMFERKRQQKRPMSPMFERKRNSVPQWDKRTAPSTFERRPPSPKYRRSNKRRKY